MGLGQQKPFFNSSLCALYHKKQLQKRTKDDDILTQGHHSQPGKPLKTAISKRHVMYKFTKLIKNDSNTRVEVIRQRLKEKNYVIDSRQVAHKIINIELALRKEPLITS